MVKIAAWQVKRETTRLSTLGSSSDKASASTATTILINYNLDINIYNKYYRINNLRFAGSQGLRARRMGTTRHS